MEHGLVAWFLDRCRENMRVVREAPEAFIIMAIVIGVVIYFAIGKLHEERFADLGAEVSFLKERIHDYQTRLNGATPEEAEKKIAAINSTSSKQAATISHLQQQLAQAEVQIRTIKQQSEPRHLSHNAKEVIGTALKNIGSKTIKIDTISEGDAPKFSNELREFFTSTGWTVLPGSTIIATANPHGIEFAWKSGDVPPAWIGVLAHAMERAGILIQHTGQHDPALPDDNSVGLIVGEKN